MALRPFVTDSAKWLAISRRTPDIDRCYCGVRMHFRSLYDGAPITLVIIRQSGNGKTGNMAQSYIMPSGIHPIEAIRSGADISVCGDCGHRPELAKVTGGPVCYVNVGHGPSGIHKGLMNGRYRAVTLDEAMSYIAGYHLRLGAWGDPGMIDAEIWKALVSVSAGHTGYTHRWKDTGADLKGLCMASVDSDSERDEAWLDEWGTFRVVASASLRERVKGEAICPASAEAQAKVTCLSCPLRCDGSKGGRVIIDHGPGGEGRAIKRAQRRAEGAR